MLGFPLWPSVISVVKKSLEPQRSRRSTEDHRRWGSLAYNADSALYREDVCNGLRHAHRQRPRGHRHRHLLQRRRHHRRQDHRHRKSLPARTPRRSLTRKGNTFSRAASTCTRISTCLSAAPPAPTISKPARAPQRSAERPRSSTSPSSTKARPCAPPSIPGCRRHPARPSAITPSTASSPTSPTAQLDEMNALVREGVTSFKLFMAYPGVFMLDDASIFKAMRATAKNGGMICMHAENGSAIDVIVQQALAEGKKAPKYHALTRPTTAEAEAVIARHRAGGDGRGARLHRALELQRRSRKSPRGPRSRPARVCGDLPAVSLSVAREHGRARLRRREVRLHAAAAREVAPGKTLERTQAGSPAGGLHRPLPVLLQGAERTGQGRLHEDSERRPRHRASHEPDLSPAALPKDASA